MSQSIMQKGWVAILKVKITAKVKMSVFVQMISLTNKHCVTKLSIGMRHYEPVCHAKRLVCYVQGLSHSKGSYDLTISAISSELLILLLSNLV